MVMVMLRCEQSSCLGTFFVFGPCRSMSGRGPISSRSTGRVGYPIHGFTFPVASFRPRKNGAQRYIWQVDVTLTARPADGTKFDMWICGSPNSEQDIKSKRRNSVEIFRNMN